MRIDRLGTARPLRLAAALVLVVCVGSLAPSSVPQARAATMTVTTTTDELNQDGDCSLREAIRAVALNSAVDGCAAGGSSATIVLPAGSYTLAVPGADENSALSGDLDISGTVTIQGAGSSTTRLDGAGLDRVLEVRPGASVTLSGLLIQNGKPPAGQRGGGIFNSGTLTIANSIIRTNSIDGGSGNDDARGGGIANDGTLTLNSVDVVDNRAGSPDNGDCDIGGGYGGGVYNNGTLTAVDSHIDNNDADGQDECGSGVSGGGLFNAAGKTATLTRGSVRGNSAFPGGYGGGMLNAGTLTLTDVQVASNYAAGGYGSGGGGGIINSGMLTLTRVTISNNGTGGRTGSGGGGIRSSGTLTISDSTVSDNFAYGGFSSGAGGGIASNGTLTMTRTRVTGNEASGAYEDAGGRGGGIYSAGVATISASTIWNNRAGGGEESLGRGGTGGGIYSSGGQLTLTNTTISGNTAEAALFLDESDADDAGQGGGLWASTTVSLLSSTIVKNRALGTHDPSSGGGLWASGTVNMANTILAENQATQSLDCAGSISSQGYNLIQHAAGCTIGGVTSGNLLGVAPGLAALLNNGGPTETHALLPGSPALDAGSPQTPGSSAVACPTTDQRGVSRPQDGDGNQLARCDIGAYEREAGTALAARAFLPLAVQTSSP